jgi:hypothetical protein
MCARFYQTILSNEARFSVGTSTKATEDISMWLDENIPLEYKDQKSSRKGIRKVAKAEYFWGAFYAQAAIRVWGYASQSWRGESHCDSRADTTDS